MKTLPNPKQNSQILLYQTEDGTTHIDVRLEEETVWLTQAQIALLFGVKRPAITKHLNNIFLSGELVENVVCSILEHTTIHGAIDGKTQTQFVKYYTLDAILSIGYRVNSKFATQFRIWANSILKEYLLKGYTVNHKSTFTQLKDLKNTVKLLENVLKTKELSADEATGLLQVISDFTYSLDILDQYDYQKLEIKSTTQKEHFRANYDNAMEVIQWLKKKFNSGNLFANEKDESFKSSINTIYQTFDGIDLYPSVEEKGAMLLYLVTKNHSFTDGNKRIAAFLFLWFLEKNGILYRENGTKLIENNTLVALTLMIAESRADEKDIMVKVLVNLINQEN